jgi:hypothetical protein
VVPVTINNTLQLEFVLDSGAADVSIPADVVLTLVRTKTLTKSDFMGQKVYALADGSTVPSQTFRIRSLKVGDLEIQNITGSVADVKGSLLLGQSFLSRLGKWSIDNQRQVLVIEGPETLLAAVDTKPSAPPAPPSIDGSVTDTRLQNVPVWALIKKDYPDWYSSQVSAAEKLIADKRPDSEVAML